MASDPSQPLGERLNVAKSIVRRRLPTELVLLDLRSGDYHGLNATAAEIFELLAEHGTRAAAADAFGRRQDATAEDVRADIDALADDLLIAGILERGVDASA